MTMKRFLLFYTAVFLLLGGSANGEARLSRTLADLGYSGDVRVDGASAAFSAYFPLPAMTGFSGEMLWDVAPSSSLRGDGVFVFFLNGMPVLTKSADELRENPSVRLPIPEDLPRERFLHVRIESRIGITEDLCRDLFSGRLFWVVGKNSGFAMDDMRIPHRTVSDFFETLFNSLHVQVPACPSREEAEVAIWLSVLLRKAVPGLQVSLGTGSGIPASSPFILIAGDAAGLPSGVEPRPGISLLGERGLLLFGDGKQNALAGFVQSAALFPFFAAVPSGGLLPERSGSPKEQTGSNLLNRAEGAGNTTVYLDVPVFPGYLPSPPQDLAFQLEGVFSLPQNPSHPARLDVFWNDMFVESEYLPDSGRFSKRLLLPAETPLLTANRLRLDVSYSADDETCRYRSALNRVTLLPSSSFHGYGKYPLNKLTWNSFGIFALRRGVLLLEEPFTTEGIRSAADMLHWLGGRYPRDVVLFPELRTTSESPEYLKDAEWVVAIASPGAVPQEIHQLLPLNIREGFLLEIQRDGVTTYSYDAESDIAVGVIGGASKPVVLLSSSSPETMSRAAAFFSSPGSARLTGNVAAFRSPEDVRSFDTRAPHVTVKQGAVLSFAERIWLRYRNFFIIGLWIMATVLFATLFVKKRRV